MVQMDGSHHDGFEGCGPRCVRMVMVDDATSTTFARFYPAETTGAAFDVFGRWVGLRGIPRSLYVDRHSIYRDKDHPEKPTQFGRAMRELSVELIGAHSPQAKGRVERMNGTLQDRLVKEMRLRDLRSIGQANAFLDAKFLEELNRRYAVKAARDQDLHRPVGAGVVLKKVLCVAEERVVGNDWCVRWNNRWLQIDARHAALNLPGRKVTVKQRGDGVLLVLRGRGRLTFSELKARPAKAGQRRPVVNQPAAQAGPGAPVEPRPGRPRRRACDPRSGYACARTTRRKPKEGRATVLLLYNNGGFLAVAPRRLDNAARAIAPAQPVIVASHAARAT